MRQTAPFALLLALLSSPASAAVDKVTSSTPIPIATPSAPIPPEALLDVGIPPLKDGLDQTDEDDTVFPEVRYAEAMYFSNQLAKTMEKSGAWGAIRVAPNTDVVMDLYITGTILKSDGESMDLEIRVQDTSNRLWFERRYAYVTGKYAYDRRLKNLGDPFQNLFTQIANDVLAERETMTEANAARLRQISELRFARDFAPEAFAAYVSEDKDGILSVTRLPAEDDSILERVRRIREREYLYVDTMQDYYDVFSQHMHQPYQDFRRASYDSVVRGRQLDKEGTRRIIAGIGAVLAGVYGRQTANNWYMHDGSTALAASGGYIIKQGLDKKQEAAAEKEKVAEMSASLESVIAPQVIAMEDRTVTLTGTVDAQYAQWKELLRQIYQQERATPAISPALESVLQSAPKAELQTNVQPEPKSELQTEEPPASRPGESQ